MVRTGPPRIDLNDSRTVRFDDTGKTPAYFCRSGLVRVDSRLIAQLKEAAVRLGNNDIRLCLHSSPEADFHAMIILQYGRNYHRPHKHPPPKGVTLHIISGTLAVFVFDDEGRVLDACELELHRNIVFPVDSGTYYMVFPTSDMAIYHESKPGPILAENDSIFPEWAPDGSVPGEAIEYKQNLIKLLSGS